MTADWMTRGGPSCARCGQPHGPHDRFCGRCHEALRPAPVPAAHAGAHVAAHALPRHAGGETLTAPPPRPVPHPHPGVPVPSTPQASVVVPRPREGSPASPPRGQRRALRSPNQDGTTRYLCAAAHLDPAFADTAIREYLVEPTRALPPTPGLDAAAVLRDAVSARYRRKLRDAALLVLLPVFVVLSPTAALLWLATAVVVAVLSGRGARTAVGVAVGVVVLLVAAVPVLGLGALLTSGTGSVWGYGGYGSGYDDPIGSGLLPEPSLSALAAGFVGLLILVVLLADEWAVTELTRRRFRTNFTVDPRRLTGWERAMRTLGHGAWQAGLRRVTQAAAPSPGAAEVIVYRTADPFVGAGDVWRRRTLPLPLTAAKHGPVTGDEPDDDEIPDLPPIAPSDLLDAVARTVEAMAGSVALAPSERLRGVETLEQVLVPATRLLRDRFAPAVTGLLPDLWEPPLSSVPRGRAAALADHPDEVARLHRCFRVESWDRDLSVSCFFTASADRRTLYLEWNHCVLPPIRESYRSIDLADREGPGWRGLLAAVLLPVTAPGRLVALLGRLSAAPRRSGEIDPDLYGAGRSLRELAAQDQVSDHFQLADARRYVELLEQTVLRGVREHLAARGYSVATVREVAHNSIVVNGGDLRGANFGTGRTTQHNDGRAERRSG